MTFFAGQVLEADDLNDEINDLTRAKGFIATTPIGTSASANTAGIITNSITFTAEAGRMYEVNALTPVVDNDGTGAQTAIITLRWAVGPTVVIGDSLAAKAVVNMPGATSSSTPGTAAETVTLFGLLAPPAGQFTVGIGLAMLSATTTGRFLASGTSGPNANGILMVKDIGLA